MRRVTNKRGAAHFEMIFSFVFFVGFVFFLFMVLQPEDTSTLTDSVIEALYDSFEEAAYTNLSSVFLKANYSGLATCFNIVLPQSIFSYSLDEGNSYVATLAGDKVNSQLVSVAGGGELNVNDDDDEFFRVLVSPEFDVESIAGCDVLDEYELGSIIERRVISYSALQNMSSKYGTDYEGLRTDLNIPGIFDFAIVPENMPIIIMESESGIPSSVEVQARDYVVEVLDKSGKLSNERFTLKIW